MAYTYEARRFHQRGVNGQEPPRTAGMRAKTDGPLLGMNERLPLWRRLVGK